MSLKVYASTRRCLCLFHQTREVFLFQLALNLPTMSDLTGAGFDAYNGRLQASALKATKAAAGFPEDITFHRSIDRDLAKQLDSCSAKVLELTNSLLVLASSASSSKGKGKTKLEDPDDLTDLFESVVVETMDRLLEGADIAIDKHTGKSKAPAISVNAQPAKSNSKPKAATNTPAPVVQHAAHLAKPQLKFKCPVDNTNGVVRTRSLKHKYNAKVPLGYVFNEENSIEDGRPLCVVSHSTG
jgi:exosome complex exonuclease RRP6